jgi:HAD superfamily hydrolase (TIGR01490 family)
MRELVFMDLDETIIRAKTMLEVMKHHYIKSEYSEVRGLIKYNELLKKLSQYRVEISDDRASVNRLFYKSFKGINVLKMQKKCVDWFSSYGVKMLNPEVVSEIRHHQELNREIVIVSGSFSECIKPIAEYLGVDKYLCTELEVDNGFFTGELLTQPVIGEGKAKAIIERWGNDNTVKLSDCFAYGDDVSDIPMLSLVGKPFAVGGSSAMIKHAKENGWETIELNNELFLEGVVRMNTKQTVQQLIDAIQAKDIFCLSSLLSINIQFENVPSKKTVLGRHNVSNIFREFFLNVEEIRWEIQEEIYHHDMAVIERLAHFRFSDRNLTVPMVSVIKVNDGKVTLFRDYFDSSAFSV